MKKLAIIGLILSLVTVARSRNAHTESPKEVVERFWHFETEGGRLTPEGWKSAATFFVKLGPPPLKKKILVVYPDFAVSEATVEGDTASVIVNVLPQGEVTSDLRLLPSRSYKEGLFYHLTLTGTHWGSGPKGDEAAELHDSPQWRIEGSGAIIWLSPAAAVRYVAELKAKSTDPTIEKNADETLSQLAKLH
jgi:hypothetical protein